MITDLELVNREGQMDNLWQLSACQAVSMLKAKQVTPLQLVEAAEARWKETEPLITAMPITCWERAKAQARAFMAEGFPDPAPQAYLYGLPIAVKDLTAVKGLPFTMGSKLFKDRISSTDDPLVQQLQLNGAIVVGKTNTPELGAGSQTFNEIFGTTLNPWDTTKTVGGSSGGSAAAVAVGQVWLATGTDFGGSLRNPASFCGVVGLRPSIGLVPQEQPPSLQVKDLAAPEALLQSVSGIIARTVHDLALGLDAAAGQTEQDAWSLPAPEPPLAQVVAAGFAPRSVAFTPDLGGITPVDPEVAQICRRAAGWWQLQGAQLAEVSPDLRDAPRAFEVLRAYCFRDKARQFASNPAAVALVKKDLVWQMQQALDLSQEQVDWAVAAHGRLMEEASRFFKQHDLLLCPTVMLPPFDATTHWIAAFQGVKLDNYIAWMVTCSAISVLTGVPAVSVPCGTTASGLPVGLQVVGPPGEDGRVLAAAAAFEAAHRHSLSKPMDVIVKK